MPNISGTVKKIYVMLANVKQITAERDVYEGRMTINQPECP